MANMSYCRFQNTANDLADCRANFDDDDLSNREHNARRKMILDMVEILESIGCEIDMESMDTAYNILKEND